KVENKRGDQQQWRNAFFTGDPQVALAHILHCLWCAAGRSRHETDSPAAIGKDLDDFVVPLLPFTRVSRMPPLSEQVKAPDDSRCNRDMSFSAENPVERTAVTGQFLFGPVS